MRQVWSVFKTPWPFDPYHPTFRVQALFLCWLLATWYVKDEVAKSQIGSCFPLDRHATTNFGHWNAEQLDSYSGGDNAHNCCTQDLKLLLSPNFTFTPPTPSTFCMSLHITKLTWHLYIFKAHMAHIKFSLTKSWTFKSGSLPPHSPYSCQLTVWTLVS